MLVSFVGSNFNHAASTVFANTYFFVLPIPKAQVLNNVLEGYPCPKVEHVRRRGAGALVDTNHIVFIFEVSDVPVDNLVGAVAAGIVKVKKMGMDLSTQ